MNLIREFTSGNLPNNTDMEEIIKDIRSCKSVYITVPQLRNLDNSLNAIDKLKLRRSTIFLYMAFPTEMSYEEYKKLQNKYGFYHLFVQGFSKMRLDENYFDSSDIDADIMTIYLKKLTELTQDLPTYSDDNLETGIKTVCILTNRIIENYLYDISTIVATVAQNANCKQRFSVPNEVIGIIDKKCVCRGLAGIFRDACRILGYDVTNVNGLSETNSGHEWNQIRLGEDWYNCDLTMDRNNILNKMVPVFLLTSDEDFYRDDYITDIGDSVPSHSSYLDIKNSKKHIANKTIPRELVYTYLYEEEKKKKSWLKQLLEKSKNFNLDEGGINR